MSKDKCRRGFALTCPVEPVDVSELFSKLFPDVEKKHRRGKSERKRERKTRWSKC